MATLEDLERRLAAVEEELAGLRKSVTGPPAAETPAERGARLLREASASQPALDAAVAKAFQEMGIVGEPVGPEKLRKMMLASGVNPEANEFSRGIIDMREE